MYIFIYMYICINKSIRSSTNLNQWRNSKTVIDWVKTIPLKKEFHFIKFDIVSFYPSISKNVLYEAIQFARNYQNINDDMINTTMNSRKAFLFYDGNPWVQKAASVELKFVNFWVYTS